MIRYILKGFFMTIQALVNVFLLPINQLVVNVFPDFAQYITQFTTKIELYIGNNLSYFSDLLPPMTKELVLLYLTILLLYYTLSISVHAIMKVIHIIQALKIW